MTDGVSTEMNAALLQAHLAQVLRYTPFEPSSDELAQTAEQKVDWITAKLLRKRYRRGSLHPETSDDIRRKVALSVSSDEPIYLILGFGGYKHFWNPSHPYVDFAELFNLAFMTEYVSPLLAVHKPGVQLDYESEDIILPLIDNYPQDSLELYAESFDALLDVYRERSDIPDNFGIRLFRPQNEEPYAADGYATRLFDRIRELSAAKTKEWSSLSTAEVADRLHRTERSIMWDGAEDLSNLTRDEREAYMRRSKILNETYYDADFEFREEYFQGGTHIPIVQTWGLSSENVGYWLTLASTQASTVDFWTGRGVLEERKDSRRFVNRVVSSSQYEAMRGRLHAVPAYDWARGDGLLRNLVSVEVVPGDLE